METPSLHTLPFELIEIITGQLSVLDLVHLRQCCRILNKYVNNTNNAINKNKLDNIQCKENYIKSIDINVIHDNLDVINIGVNHTQYISDIIWANAAVLAIALHHNKIVRAIISRSWLGELQETRLRNRNNTIQLPISFYDMFLNCAIEICNIKIVGLLISITPYNEIPQRISEMRKIKSQIELTSPRSPAVIFIDKINYYINSEIMNGGDIYDWKTQVNIKRYIMNLRSLND